MMPSKKGRNYYTMTEDMTEQQAQDLLRNIAAGKQSVYSIFEKVINKSQSTIRVANLTPDELGISKLPFRTYLELALFCEDIVGDDEFSEYFTKMGAIQSDSSLGREGFLMKLLVTMKKELADVSPKPKSKNKGWFKKSGGGAPGQE